MSYGKKLADSSAGCRVKWSWFGTTRKWSKDQVERAAQTFAADAKSISGSKKLLDSKADAFKACTAIKGSANKYWESVTLPYPERGVRLIARDRIDSFVQRMGQFRDDLATNVAALSDVYALLREQAQARLGDLFNPLDYPADITSEFALEWDFPSLNPPDYLAEMNPEVYQQELAKVRAQFESAVSMAEQAFLKELSDMVSHLSGCLSPKDDGSRKIFRDSAVTNLREFFDRFKQLNIGSNQQLDSLVSQAESLLSDVTAGELRQNVLTRQSVQHQLANLQPQIDEQLQDAPTRKIMLGGAA